MQRELSVLLADDCAEALDVIEAEFAALGFRVAKARDGAEAWARFQSTPPDLVVTDVRMPEGDGFDLLRRIRAVSDLPVILLTAYGEIPLAVAAMRDGADDYLRFPDDLPRLLARARELLGDLAGEPRDAVARMITGRSKPARELRSRVRALASLPVPLLLCGEPGSGRSQVARALHAASDLASLPLVHWNEGAAPLPKQPCVLLIEEIERLERSEQERWLLEMRRISQRRPGVVARLLASASPGLPDAVAAKRFHPELWGALARFQLQIPPLRDRLEDLEALVEDFLREAAQRLGRPNLGISSAALAELQRRLWPGNLRELRDVLEQAGAFEKGARIGATAVRSAVEEVIARRGDSLETQRAARRSAQRQELVDLLAACGGNVAEMARRLSLTRGAVVYRLQKHGLMV
jgi:two-component system C4-dicarboxylate transport response regulator DctD